MKRDRLPEVPPIPAAHTMRRCLSILFFAFLMGCASAPPVPLPATTDFDDNPKARETYLKAYTRGYRAGLSGEYSVWDGPNNIIAEAFAMGWSDGQIAARLDEHRKFIERMKLDK